MFKLKRDLSSLKQKVGGLLTPEEVVQKTNELTKEVKETKTIAEPQVTYKTTQKLKTKKPTQTTNTKSIRRKYTTMLDPRLSEKLKIAALQRGISAADLMEQLLLDFFAETK